MKELVVLGLPLSAWLLWTLAVGAGLAIELVFFIRIRRQSRSTGTRGGA